MKPLRTLSDIHTLNWQAQLGAAGQVVENWQDVDQAIRIILMTRKGSDRHRPTFGWGGFIYLDWPVDRARPHLVRESIEAIRRWETRADVRSVDIDVAGSRLLVVVAWTLPDSISRTTEVHYGRLDRA